MRSIQAYQEIFSSHLSSLRFEKEPIGLYKPISYIIQLEGKRMRPVLALMACEAMGKEPISALGVASAVELFHNFTLLHDDIMDGATLRRGDENEEWEDNFREILETLDDCIKARVDGDASVGFRKGLEQG